MNFLPVYYSRAPFSRQFLLSQRSSQFLVLFFISSSIILPSSVHSSTTAFFNSSVHFARPMLLHIHISNASSRFCSFRCSAQVSAPYNATTPHKALHECLLQFFFHGSAENASLPVTSFLCHCYPLLYFLTAVHVATDITPQVFEATHLFEGFIFNSHVFVWFSSDNHGFSLVYIYLHPIILTSVI